MIKLEKPINPNYCAIVARPDSIRDLDGCDNIRGAVFFGSQVIVGKDVTVDDVGLFFPAECALSEEFLKNNNLYRDSTLNADTSAKGFFEAQGRVKTMRFRGHKSEGFWIPITSLRYLDMDSMPPVGAEFDRIGEHVICTKYVPRGNTPGVQSAKGNKEPGFKARVLERMRGQFRFHEDTAHLRRNAHKFLPSDIITITDKWHGTSAVYAHVLMRNEPLRGWRKAFTWLGNKLGFEFKNSQYKRVWSSRTVLKGIDGEEVSLGKSYYDADVWGDVGRKVLPGLPEGYTVYGEIVGWASATKHIQKDYTYGCEPGEHVFRVYRITYTTPNGEVIDFTWDQLKAFCRDHGLTPVMWIWRGSVSDFCSQYRTDYANWIDVLYEKEVGGFKCGYNLGRVPKEGVVVRNESLSARTGEYEAYKLKNFDFLERETRLLDKGEVDTETEETYSISTPGDSGAEGDDNETRQ